MRLLVTILLATALSACATNSQKVFSNYNDGPAATILPSSRYEGATIWDKMWFATVDDRWVPPGSTNRTETPLLVAPGQHSFVVAVEFSRGIGTGEHRAAMKMQASLEAGRTYQLAGALAGTHYEAWLEDVHSKRRASLPASGEWKAIQTPAVVPIIVPIK